MKICNYVYNILCICVFEYYVIIDIHVCLYVCMLECVPVCMWFIKHLPKETDSNTYYCQ